MDGLYDDPDDEIIEPPKDFDDPASSNPTSADPAAIAPADEDDQGKD